MQLLKLIELELEDAQKSVSEQIPPPLPAEELLAKLQLVKIKELEGKGELK
jgi:hypothetical protein